MMGIANGLPPDDPLRALPRDQLARLLDDLIESWPRGKASDHLRLEISAAFRRGHPLDLQDPVPGCNCPTCTGTEEDHPARIRPRPRQGSESWERQVEEARARPILEVARSMGLEPKKAGKEYWISCPLHDDRTPSFSINAESGLWHCFSCGEGGDGIRLVMEMRQIGFGDAVRELAA